MKVTDVSFLGKNRAGKVDAKDKTRITTREKISPPPKKLERRGREDRVNSRESTLLLKSNETYVLRENSYGINKMDFGKRLLISHQI